MKLNIRNTFSEELPADENTANTRRQVLNAAFSYVQPRVPSKPSIIHVADDVAKMLSINKDDSSKKDFLDIFSGTKLYENTNPYAMCYGGHQFGNWAGQLGDGRAINLFEIEAQNNIWALQLKGAGATPYSRTADGLAVLRSSIREHLCSEAMYHLGVPTTRSLSLVLTGDEVLRDMLYNGNPGYEKGAIVCRVSPTFIRFGNFEIFSSRQDIKSLKLLTDYTIKYFFPQINSFDKQAYLQLIQEVANKTLSMVINWLRVGFVHGVMNTDNMSILGLTIDYGPYGWVDNYDVDWTPNTTDAGQRRYRYGQQGNIALWNLYQLANALYPLIEDEDALENILQDYRKNYATAYENMMLAKLGLTDATEETKNLVNNLENILQKTETDMTIFFRHLSLFSKTTIVDESGIFLDCIKDSFYFPEEIKGEFLMEWQQWFSEYKKLLTEANIDDELRKERMNLVNPKYVLRNYMSQLAIDKADEGDYNIINELYQILKKPYDEQPENEKWFSKRPDWARTKVGCSMLSCSS